MNDCFQKTFHSELDVHDYMVNLVMERAYGLDRKQCPFNKVVSKLRMSLLATVVRQAANNETSRLVRVTCK